MMFVFVLGTNCSYRCCTSVAAAAPPSLCCNNVNSPSDTPSDTPSNCHKTTVCPFGPERDPHTHNTYATLLLLFSCRKKRGDKKKQGKLKVAQIVSIARFLLFALDIHIKKKNCVCSGRRPLCNGIKHETKTKNKFRKETQKTCSLSWSGATANQNGEKYICFVGTAADLQRNLFCVHH